MSKLFKLKRWLTLAEAANHLTRLFGETVSEADILRLALDHKLKLSAIFVGYAQAFLCKPVDESELIYREIATLDLKGVVRKPVGGQVLYGVDGQTLQVQKKPIQLDSDEPYGLTMLGGEAGQVEYLYWKHAHGPKVESSNIDGTFVSSGKNIFQLIGVIPGKKGEDPYYYPLGELPEHTAIVVTPGALTELENSLREGDEKLDKPLGTTERNQLLKMVIGMAIDSYGYDPLAKKNDATKQIADDLAKIGISIDTDTVRKYLKEAANTVTYEMPKP